MRAFGRFNTPTWRVIPKLVLFFLVATSWSIFTDWWAHTVAGLVMGLMYGHELLPAAIHRHILQLHRRQHGPVDVSVDEEYRQ